MIALPDEANGALAVGWATVELDRAAIELADLLAAGATFVKAPSSVTLGARCRVGLAASGVLIVLLEPETEGRLAGALARDGEGWRATWFEEPEPAARPLRSAGAKRGPVGMERLLPDTQGAGLYRLVVEAVPSPP